MAGITLDVTLRDLYRLDGGDKEDIALINVIPIAEIQMAKGIPPPRKYMYQTPSLPTDDVDILAREFLQLAPQLLGFIAGEMPLFLFDIDSTSEDCSSKLDDRQYRTDAHNVFDRLCPTQKPKLQFIETLQDIKHSETRKFVQVNPMDCMDKLPQLIPPLDHYRVLSKRSLANSGLPTPKGIVLELTPDLHQLNNTRKSDEAISRIIYLIQASQIPFVVKLPQSLSGQGIFLVREETERHAAIEVLRPELRRMMTQVTKENHHMSPCSLIIQDMVPGEAVALSFFVTRKGRVVFNACCGQLLDHEGGWGGGFIDYRIQQSLSVTYAGTMNNIATYLHQNGYWGPVGADIITDEEGGQLVIDLNVRVSGSHPLGVFKDFFKKRGFPLATLIFPFMVNGTRDEFETAFGEESQAGSLVIIGWVHMRDGKMSMSTIIVAQEDEECLRKLIARVKEWELSE